MTTISDQSQVCLDAVVNCENVLAGLGDKKPLSSQILKLLNECAQICMGTFYEIRNHSVNVSQLAILCIGVCDKCAEVCDSIDNILFKQCAQACQYCSNSMNELASNGLE
jgi:hypothetical protein